MEKIANSKQQTAKSKSIGNHENNKYVPQQIEAFWQNKWIEEKTYEPDLDSAKRPFYNLMMFPYPSAEGLHVGNFFTFSGIDAYGRFKRMQGYDVFEPIGLDGFGIHSENFAIKVGRTPYEHARISEENFYRQLHLLGNGFSWSRTVETYDEQYFKWTQWLFIELFKAGLAYKESATVNFCPSCKTVLSDEQVIDGKCERCSSVIEKKELQQWFFKITNYADRLLQNTEKLDWTEKVKIAQKNWIGKKSGINIKYKIEGTDKAVTVFTTRPDTNFGATFIVIAPENALVKEITTEDHKNEVEQYIKSAVNKSDIERIAEGREKTGAFTGAYAINHLTGYRMPIWVSDFVLSGFGTGAVVGVPGHDKRDFEFAKKFGLEIIRVVIGSDNDTSKIDSIEQVQEEEGKMVNSQFLNGMDIHEATEKIMDHIEKESYGQRVVTFHLRDWLISRQRYWGPPIPMIYCKACAEKHESWFSKNGQENKAKNWKADGWYPEERLPVSLPQVEDFKPMGTGKAPLANYPEFYEVKCPGCGGEATRETDVSDTFLDSSWYFFRYLATDRDDLPLPMKEGKANDSNLNVESNSLANRLNWLPVTSYIGGAEHAVLHLLYSRFITMVLKDLGYIDFEEPFTKFRANGLIIKDGAKMSKSKGNVINPDDYIRKYGTDTLRTYLGFIGPFTQGGDFQDAGIEGINRFLKRVWYLVISKLNTQNENVSKENEAAMHQAIKGVTEDMEELRFNTAIAKVMTYYNKLSDQKEISKEELLIILKLLSPFAPHLTEELYQKIKINNAKEYNSESFNSIHLQPWPQFDSEKIVSDIFTIAVQINGKLRETLSVAADKISNKEEVVAIAKGSEKVNKYLENQSVKKVIYVPGKILNFVV